MAAPAVKVSAKDFVSDQDVRWCPGCGDYSILANVQRVMPELGVRVANGATVARKVLGAREHPFALHGVDERLYTRRDSRGVCT